MRRFTVTAKYTRTIECADRVQAEVLFEEELRAGALRPAITVRESPKAPERWHVGMLVEYLHNAEWAWSRGTLGRIDSFDEGTRDRPGSESQVFFVRPLREDGSLDPNCCWWTTPQDVVWIEEDMNVTYRAATEADHKELVKIAKSSEYTKDFSNRVMFSNTAAYEKGWIRVAVQLERIVGFTCVRHKARTPETMLYFVTVDPEVRSQGIGEGLLNDVMEHGPHRLMALNVMKKNTRAVKFYKRLGFTIAGEAMDGNAHRMEREWPA